MARISEWPCSSDAGRARLRGALDGLATRYPALALHGVVGDFALHLDRLPRAAGDRRLLAFLGGTVGNLSALVAARHTAALARGERPSRWRLAATAETHSSVASAARVMDVDVLLVEADERGRMRL